jgi:hypothetical protein
MNSFKNNNIMVLAVCWRCVLHSEACVKEARL